MSPNLHKRLVMQIIPAGLIVGALWVAIGSDSGLLTRHAEHSKLASFRARLNEVEAENMRLRRLVRRMRTDPVQIERAAAEHLLVARPGSVIYRFPAEELEAEAKAD
ncbi:MAG: septum formation initiator family protein [Deltaproteobacteria bacterium]|nr:septum formation initiator family protein [Deltaproteobacteria bacterium]